MTDDPTSEGVVTIGIDLAAQRAETAACVVAWNRSRAVIARLRCGLSDDDLLALVDEFAPKKVAIDAPFGWPTTISLPYGFGIPAFTVVVLLAVARAVASADRRLPSP